MSWVSTEAFFRSCCFMRSSSSLRGVSLFSREAAKAFHAAFPILFECRDGVASRSVLQCLDDGRVLAHRSAGLFGSVPIGEFHSPHLCLELRHQNPEFAIL